MPVRPTVLLLIADSDYSDKVKSCYSHAQYFLDISNQSNFYWSECLRFFVTVSLTMCHVLKLLGQLLHGQFGLGLTLELGKFPQNLAATEGTEHRLGRLQERARQGEPRLCFTENKNLKSVCMKSGKGVLRLRAVLPFPRRRRPSHCGSAGRPRWRGRPRERGSASLGTSSRHAAVYWLAGMGKKTRRGVKLRQDPYKACLSNSKCTFGYQFSCKIKWCFPDIAIVKRIFNICCLLSICEW